MKIIIAGGGKVGSALIRQLSAEGHDITVIDKEPAVIQRALDTYDVMGVVGNCAMKSKLLEADVENAELLIAAADADEVNLLCCITAHRINDRLQSIARIRDPEYSDQLTDMHEDFGLTMLINPDQTAAIEIDRQLQLPGFRRREPFARGRVQIAELLIEKGNPLSGRSLYDIEKVVGAKVLICAVVRNGEAVIPGGRFLIEEGDKIFVTATTENLSRMLRALSVVSNKVKHVMIAGGGRIAYYLAQRLDRSGIRSTIIEKNMERCRFMAEEMGDKTCIVNGNAGDTELLLSNGLRNCDALVTITDMDETNIITSLYGKQVGVPHIITKLAHFTESALTDQLPLGSTINVQELCSSNVVRFVRAAQNKSDEMLSMHRFADARIEAIEFRIDDTALNCGVPLKNLKLKKNILIACITHGTKHIIPDGNSVFSINDIVIVVTRSEDVVGSFNQIFEEKTHELQNHR